MADIKTRDVVKGTIKKIDKAAIAADRMRSAYVQAKEKAEHTTHPDGHNAEEYASDRVEGGVDRITRRTSLISRGARGWKKRNGMCPKQRTVFRGSGKSGRLSR